MNQLLSIVICVLLISACGGSSDLGSNTPTGDKVANTNVASQFQGGVALSDANSQNTPNAIDEQNTTFWMSESGVPLVIKFEVVERIQTITLRKNAATVNRGSNPDIVVELSLDGLAWKKSAITNAAAADVPCTATSASSTHIECNMNAYSAQYLRITSQNGRTYEFAEIEALTFHQQ